MAVTEPDQLHQVAGRWRHEGVRVDARGGQYHHPHLVVAGTKSPWAGKRTVKLAELVTEPWIIYSGNGKPSARFSALRGVGLTNV